MTERILISLFTYLIDKLLALITRKWEEYEQDEEKKKELKGKVHAIKTAKTKDEIRSAIRDLSI